MGAPKELGIKVDKILICVKHIKQKYTWDCGISCIMMILDEKSRDHFIEKFEAICEEEGFDESTWSIDLAYILKRFGIKHQYITITLGVHPEFSSETFYRNVLSKPSRVTLALVENIMFIRIIPHLVREMCCPLRDVVSFQNDDRLGHLQEDRQRVIRRFQLSSSKGVLVEEGSVTIVDILSHLSLGGPVIVLVNANLLTCDSCHQNGYDLRACIPCSPSPPFQGHYIVLVGFNYNLGKVFYRNPGLKDGICSTNFAAFDKARKSFGTDEDIIFIHNFSSEN